MARSGKRQRPRYAITSKNLLFTESALARAIQHKIPPAPPNSGCTFLAVTMVSMRRVQKNTVNLRQIMQTAHSQGQRKLDYSRKNSDGMLSAVCSIESSSPQIWTEISQEFNYLYRTRERVVRVAVSVRVHDRNSRWKFSFISFFFFSIFYYFFFCEGAMKPSTLIRLTFFSQTVS